MEYSKEQLIAGLKKAHAAGDIAAANEIAAAIDALGYQPENPSVSQMASNLSTSLSEGFKDVTGRVASTLEDPRLSGPVAAPMAVSKGILGTAEALGSTALSSAGDVLSTLTPDPIEKFVVNTAQEWGSKFANLDMVKEAAMAIGEGMDALDQWGSRSPEHYAIAENLKGLGSTTLAMLGNNARMITGKKLKQTGGKLKRSGDVLETEIRHKNAEELLTPEDFQKQNKTRVEGKWDRVVYDPTDFDKEMIAYVKTIEGVDPSRAYTYNREAISNHIETIASKLDKSLEKYTGKVQIDTRGLRDEITDAINEVIDSPDFRAAQLPKSQITAMHEMADEILGNLGNSPRALLNARKMIDKRFKDVLKNKYFDDPDTISNKDQVLSIIRNAVNAKIIEAVPDVNIQRELRKQHLMFRARDIVSEKAKKESLTKIGRLMATLHDKTGMHIAATPLSTYGTVATAGYIANDLSPLTLAALIGTPALYLSGKALIKSPNARRSLGGMLLKAGQLAKDAKAVGDIATYTMLTDLVEGIREDYNLQKNYVEKR